MVAAGERPFGQVRGQRIGVRDPDSLVHVAAIGGKVREAAHGLRIADERDELVAHVRSPGDPVRLGERARQADEGIEKRQLVRDGGEAVMLDEREREPARILGAAVEEDALRRDEHVVEDRERLDHLVLRGDRTRPRIGVGVQKVGAEEAHARGRNGHGERDRPVLLALREGTRRNDDHLVDVGGAGRVHLGAADDDTVRAPLDHAHVEVRIGLCARAFRAVTLDVRLSDCDRQITVAAMPVVVLDAGVGLRAVGDAVQREQRVRADLLDEDHERVAAGGGGLDQRRAAAQVVRVPGQVVVGGMAVGHRQVGVLGLRGELELERGVTRRDPELGMGRHVIDPLPPVPHLTAIAKPVQVLLCRPHRPSLRHRAVSRTRTL